MKNNYKLYEAMGNIDDKIIRETEAYQAQKKDRSRLFTALEAVAVIAVGCGFIVLSVVLTKVSGPKTDPAASGEESSVETMLETDTEAGTTDKAIETSERALDFTPNFRKPTLEELYGEEPYATLLPRYMLSGYKLKSTYQALYDERIHKIPSEFEPVNLEIQYANKNSYLTINISKIKVGENNNYHFVDINDLKSYDLKYVPTTVKPEEHTLEELNEIYSNIAYINSALFIPDQICESVIRSRTMSDNLFMINIYSKGYIVNYLLIAESPVFFPNADELYRMITSSLTFKK